MSRKRTKLQDNQNAANSNITLSRANSSSSNVVSRVNSSLENLDLLSEEGSFLAEQTSDMQTEPNASSAEHYNEEGSFLEEQTSDMQAEPNVHSAECDDYRLMYSLDKVQKLVTNLFQKAVIKQTCKICL